MASVIRFGTIDRPRSSTRIYAPGGQNMELNYTPTAHNEPVHAVMSKNRHTFTNTYTAEASAYINYNLGSTTNRTYDYFAIIRADRIHKEADENLYIRLYTDDSGGGTYTLRHEINYTLGSTRHDPKNQDLIAEFTPFTTDHQWVAPYVVAHSATSQTWCFTQFYFGELFDIGADPMDFTAKENLRVGTLSAENGSLHSSEAQKQPIQFTISWTGITDAKAQSAQDLIWNANEHGIVLYCTNDDLTDGYTMCHCHKMELEVERVWTNYNIVTMKLEEII